jgi:hypothetical protein
MNFICACCGKTLTNIKNHDCQIQYQAATKKDIGRLVELIYDLQDQIWKLQLQLADFNKKEK